jgi:hypothetical protein
LLLVCFHLFHCVVAAVPNDWILVMMLNFFATSLFNTDYRVVTSLKRKITTISPSVNQLMQRSKVLLTEIQSRATVKERAARDALPQPPPGSYFLALFWRTLNRNSSMKLFYSLINIIVPPYVYLRVAHLLIQLSLI